MRAIDMLFGHGRRIESTTISGFLQLYLLAALRPWRHRLYRHQGEMRHIDDWLARAETLLPRNYDLAQGVLKARRLVKGYADTHARGLSKFDRVLSAVPLLEARADAGDWMARLIAAALKDEDGQLLDAALKTVAALDAV
jgi:indolepyruvate ferredoxin oxidoreductase beta subunit